MQSYTLRFPVHWIGWITASLVIFLCSYSFYFIDPMVHSIEFAARSAPGGVKMISTSILDVDKLSYFFYTMMLSNIN